jgi:hypothetical protein
MNELWEILVPTEMDSIEITKDYHKEWDEFVRSISGGLTLMYPSQGQWVEPKSGELYMELMIPVRIACSEQQIDYIIDFTLSHYKQKAVMAYQLSTKVIIRERSDV